MHTPIVRVLRTASEQRELARSPHRLRGLTKVEERELAVDIRQFLVEKVAAAGGHLGPNLGVVELTIALHQVFDSPSDRILYDIGHQTYVHKMLTGRMDGFNRLRKWGGLSGYASQAESVHDVIENSHASTTLAYADGLVKANGLRGADHRAIVAVIGDGALTGGMAWEGLNNLGGSGRPVVVVVNDNGRSYAPTNGALAAHLQSLREGSGEGNLFSQLGFEYFGPVDGHDIAAIRAALTAAKETGCPAVVHCLTVKGKGYRPAEEDQADCLHGVGVIDVATGKPTTAGDPTWTEVFEKTIVELGGAREDLVCVTASMLRPVGFGRFAEQYPDRVFDVGIAEQHAVCSAAGLAMGGLRPVVAVYSTFLNRAFDQVVMDVAMHRLPVTFVLDRAGITGPDGPSHHGLWDLAMLGGVPGLRAAAPRDPTRLRQLTIEAVSTTSGPTVIRYPKSTSAADIPAIDRAGSVDVLFGEGEDVLMVAVGPTAERCVHAAKLLVARGIGVTVVDPRWCVPASRDLVDLAAGFGLVFTVEDGYRVGGVGSQLAQAVRDSGSAVPVHNLGLPRRFIPQGSRGALLDMHGFAPDSIARAVAQAAKNSPLYRHQPDQAPSPYQA